jgi:mitogen-activated protein kinase kinase
MRRRIVRELQIMHDTNSEYIVNFYGAFLSDTNDVIMCMEYMDVGYGLEMKMSQPVLTIP